jgi:hypothetical protein
MGKKEVEFLIVGSDDSNHAGTAKGELDVATFSFLPEDSVVRNFPNTRNYPLTQEWLSSPHRDYRSALLTADRYRHSCQNLVETIPKLVRGYMEEEDIYARILKVFLDGILFGENKEKIKREFLGFRGIEKVVADNFIKKHVNRMKHTEKHPKCPAVVYHADVLANHLYPLSIDDKKLIFID